jgi:hypothetical protein
MTKVKVIASHFLMISIFAAILLFLDIDELYLVTPILACTWVFITLFIYLWWIDCQPPVVDIGVLCALSTTIYAVYPIINFWVGGMTFGEYSDSRLSSFNILPSEIFDFQINNIIYLTSFCLCYALLRHRGHLIAKSCLPLPKIFLRNIIIIIIPIYLLIIILSFLYQTIFLNPTYEMESYQRYTATLANLPLFIRQILFKSLALLSILKLALLFYLTSRIRERGFLLIISLWVIFEFYEILINKGGRSGFVFLLISLLIYYHLLIKNLPFKLFFLISILGFLGFNILGALRSNIPFEEFSVSLASFLAHSLSTTNEFQSLFGTAYDVYLKNQSGIDFPVYLYFNDLISVLPPQQLLPFEKVAASEWYLRELGISGTGQGYMWGVVSQSIIGGGYFELFLRGIILAFLLAKYHNYFIKHQRNYLVTFFYVFLCVRIYYTYRDTTFAFLPILLWEALPFYLLLKLLGLPNYNNISVNNRDSK